MTSIQLDQRRLIERPGVLFGMCHVPGGSVVYCGGTDARIHRLDLTLDEPCQASMSGHRSYVTGVVLTPEGQLVTSGWDRQLIWWDPDVGRPVRRVLAHEKWIRKVALSPDGRSVASVADDMVCRIWDTQSGNLRHELRGHSESTPHHYPSMLHTCAYSPDGAYLATGDKIGHIVIWSTETGGRIATVECPEVYTWDPVQRRHSIGGIRSLRFSPDSRLLAVGGIAHITNIDGLGGKALVQVYDWRSGDRTHKFEHDEQKGIVEDLHFVRGGSWLVGGGGGKKGLFLVMDVASADFVHTEVAAMHIHQFDADDAFLRIFAVGYEAVASWGVTVADTEQQA